MSACNSDNKNPINIQPKPMIELKGRSNFNLYTKIAHITKIPNFWGSLWMQSRIFTLELIHHELTTVSIPY